jgi:hypothetical protein
LLESFVFFFGRLFENPLYMRSELRLAPPISRRQLGAVGVTEVGTFEERHGGGRIIARIAAGRQVETWLRTAGVLLDESAGHARV